MTRSHRFHPAGQSLATLALLLASSQAAAQATPLPEGISVGEWTFRPSFELRLRGDYRHAPFDVGGRDFFSTAVLGPDPQPFGPVHAPVGDQWQVAERARIGVAVDRGPVTGVFVLQDSRPLVGAPFVSPFGGGLFPGLAPWEGYIDVHTKTRGVFFRVGRQKIVWGDGRLVGDSDWSAAPRSFDAARFGFAVGDFDVELFASLLQWPNAGYLPIHANGKSAVLSSGAQLYGLNAIWHILPLLHAEVTALARIAGYYGFDDDLVLIAHDGAPGAPRGWLMPGNTFAFDARVSGEQRGFRYSAEGAYELGHIDPLPAFGPPQQKPDVRAFAVAAQASLQTALPAHLTFALQGAYASGDDPSQGTLTRFDPIVPEEHTNHGRMGLYAWSNLIEAGAGFSARPVEKLRLEAAYHFVGLASPKGRWTSAALLPIGASPTNESHILGHEADLIAQFVPWPAITLEAAYGLFVTGEAAKNILESAGRSRPGSQHFTYVQATVHAP
jgi:hypothetical protein